MVGEAPWSGSQDGPSLHGCGVGECDRHRSGHSRTSDIQQARLDQEEDQGPRGHPEGAGGVDATVRGVEKCVVLRTEGVLEHCEWSCV